MQYWCNIDSSKYLFSGHSKTLRPGLSEQRASIKLLWDNLARRRFFPFWQIHVKLLTNPYQYILDKSRARLLVCSSLEVKWAENEWVSSFSETTWLRDFPEDVDIYNIFLVERAKKEKKIYLFAYGTLGSKMFQKISFEREGKIGNVRLLWNSNGWSLLVELRFISPSVNIQSVTLACTESAIDIIIT